MNKNKVRTVWEIWTYDVWGNAKDGYEVNDRSCVNREYEMMIKIEICNQGTQREFKSVYPSNKQIREAFSLKKISLNLEGDDTTIYVNHATDGYPIGEMIRIDV